MRLIVGLGNPGAQYAHTRHNAGFEVVSLLAERWRAPLGKLKCQARLAEARVFSERVLLAQPQTFMNLSGESVAGLMRYYKILPAQLLVCYDDVDLPPGRLRVRGGGGAGTHNGMRSIVELLGRDDFPRVRVGIGAAPPGWALADYVLSRHETPAARACAARSIVQAADVVEECLRGGLEAATRLANQFWRAQEAAASCARAED